MVDHVKPAIRDNKPNHVILHVSQIAKPIVELAMSLIKDGNSVIVSGIVSRFDSLNKKVNEVNTL